MGGNYPVRVQSMTNTDTMDTMGTVAQAIRMIEAGCEYVRITTPRQKDAENLAEIKKELLRRGFRVPLIADVHFNPKIAEIASRIVEKVRINPGNYIHPTPLPPPLQGRGLGERSIQSELDNIAEKLYPLLKICKENGTAIRIGTNHGSLSERILQRFGDTPFGMVESALEYGRIC
ncbi:MAG: flavodoxin-dependent (E)-4-hydroxy-3-methylbut-2-enyl-diphosphate synthase, partial [Bacteroidota bacterium]